MEDNFRNALIIISALIIAAIFVHGLWTIRKNKNPYKLKAKPENIDELARNFDGSGFDQDGVSQPKVIGKNEKFQPAAQLADDEVPLQPAPAPDFSEEPLPKDLKKQDADNDSIVAMHAELDDESAAHFEQSALDGVNTSEPKISSEVQLDEEPELKLVVESAPVYADPVIQAKPAGKIKPVSKPKRVPASSELKRNQMEINFGGEPVSAIDNTKERKQRAGKSEASLQPEPEFLVISVLAADDQHITGAALLPSLLTLGMKFGEMEIFHRHEDNAGNGAVTFSLANMLNPGTFDLNNIETFTTKGISLFMRLPNAGNPFEVFEQMLAAAKHLAQEFNGQLLDDKRSVLTKQTEQHYVGKIREFERKSRIGAG